MSEIRLQVSNLLSYSDAARIIGVTRVTIYAMIDRGQLHPVDIADRRYLLRDEVERIAREREEVENGNTNQESKDRENPRTD